MLLVFWLLSVPIYIMLLDQKLHPRYPSFYSAIFCYDGCSAADQVSSVTHSAPLDGRFAVASKLLQY